MKTKKTLLCPSDDKRFEKTKKVVYPEVDAIARLSPTVTTLLFPD